MNQMKFCQSCAMPITDDILGTNEDGSKNADYCHYCYKDGAYTANCTMDEMIEFCVGPMVEHSPGMTEEAARTQMKQFFPQLKRWASQL